LRGRERERERDGRIEHRIKDGCDLAGFLSCRHLHPVFYNLGASRIKLISKQQFACKAASARERKADFLFHNDCCFFPIGIINASCPARRTPLPARLSEISSVAIRRYYRAEIKQDRNLSLSLCFPQTFRCYCCCCFRRNIRDRLAL